MLNTALKCRRRSCGPTGGSVRGWQGASNNVQLKIRNVQEVLSNTSSLLHGFTLKKPGSQSETLNLRLFLIANLVASNNVPLKIWNAQEVLSNTYSLLHGFTSKKSGSQYETLNLCFLFC